MENLSHVTRASTMDGRRNVVLTVDYEIFGNGTGDVRQHIIEPTRRMAGICRRHGVPLTVFFEVEEYLAFVRHRTQLTRWLGYDPASEIREQLVALARDGHDLQLHLHPEWFGTEPFLVDGQVEWKLRPEKSSVDSLFDSQAEVSAYVAERKRVIDDILAEAGSDQRVTCYRAGAFCIQPGARLLRALAEHGFVVDSSVVKQMYRQDAVARLDFSSAPEHRRHWPVRDNAAREDPTGSLTEVPIYSRMGRRFHQLTPRRLLAKFSGNTPKRSQQQLVERLSIGRTPASVLRFLLQRFPTKLDFHNMSAQQMLRWIRNAPPAPADDEDIIVLIGHTKEHRDDREFERFVHAVVRDPSLKIISMNDVATLVASSLVR